MKKYKALYLKIKNEIQSGILKTGDRLLSVRQTASSSGVSVNTVITAYGILADEGLIRARERGGYYVLAGALNLTRADAENNAPFSEKFATAAREAGARLDQLYERLLHIDPSFATAAPGTDILPVDALGRAAASLSADWVAYDNPQGDMALRRKIAVVNQDIDGPSLPGDIIITNGATEAINIVMQTLLCPGDTVALESPTYMNYFRQLAPLGTEVLEIPAGPGGMDLDVLEQALEKQTIRMIIVQPNVQNPTGSTMDDQARERLTALAEKHEAYLVQDDVYGDLYFGRFRPGNLALHSDYPGLIQISSYSKSVSPGLRIGWIRSRSLAGRFTEEKLRMSMETSRATQAILSAFIGTPDHLRHITAMRTALESRVNDHIQRLSEVLPPSSFIPRPSGGCLVWIALPARINAARVFERCAGKGLIAAPGALFSASGYFDNYIRLNAGIKLTPRRREALAILGECASK